MSRDDAVTKAEHSLHDQSNLLPRRQLIAVFGLLSVTLLIAFIDQNGISTTLPTIAADLDAKDTISWAGTASLIANTTFQMLYGRLSDIFGRKTIFLTAIAFLSIADLLCGLSQNAAMFYFFRAVAGIGGGGITNLAMIIVSDVVTLEQRGKYQGIIGSMVGLGNVIGPFIAAAFIGSGASWRGFFYTLAPLGALTGVLSYLYLPSKPRTAGWVESAKKVDYMGSLTSSLAVIFLLIPISGGGAYFAWNSPMVISMLVIGGLFLILFVVIEWKVARLPMMPVAIYNNPVVVVMLAQSFFLGLVYQSNLYYVPLYLQNAHQFSVMTSALIFMSLVGVQSLFSISSGLYISRFKRYGEIIWLGFGMWTLGAGLTLIYDRHTSPGIIIIPLLLIGAGVGFVFQPTLIALQAHSTKARRAVIISNRNFYRCSGGACGLAMSAAILQARLRSALPAEYAYLAHSTYSLPAGPVPDEVLDAYMAASRGVFMAMIPLIGICFLGTALIRDRGLEPVDEVPSEQPMGDVEMSDQEEPGPVEEDGLQRSGGSDIDSPRSSNAREHAHDVESREKNPGSTAAQF